jgi:hypothetical protein
MHLANTKKAVSEGVLHPLKRWLHSAGRQTQLAAITQDPSAAEDSREAAAHDLYTEFDSAWIGEEIDRNERLHTGGNSKPATGN